MSQAVTVESPSGSSKWTLLGLVVALFGLLAIVNGARILLDVKTIDGALLRDGVVALGALGFCLLIRRGEGLGWDSVGLGRRTIGSTLATTALTLVACAIAIAVGFGVNTALGLPFVGEGGAKLPLWVVTIGILRAGIVEELFYRGYAIERLRTWTGIGWIAISLPLIIFTAGHFRQGIGGMALVFLLGAAFTATYLWKRNLWANMLAHFLVNFIPNVLIPILGD
jgi:membrane protease YdiL (CAAX protease family)